MKFIFSMLTEVKIIGEFFRKIFLNQIFPIYSLIDKILEKKTKNEQINNISNSILFTE